MRSWTLRRQWEHLTLGEALHSAFRELADKTPANKQISVDDLVDSFIGILEPAES